MHLLGANAYTNDTCSSLVFTGGLFVFITKLSAVATPQDKIIKVLEAEIVKLKTQLFDNEERYRKMSKKYDEMGIKLYGGGRK